MINDKANLKNIFVSGPAGREKTSSPGRAEKLFFFQILFIFWQVTIDQVPKNDGNTTKRPQDIDTIISVDSNDTSF